MSSPQGPRAENRPEDEGSNINETKIVPRLGQPPQAEEGQATGASEFSLAIRLAVPKPQHQGSTPIDEGQTVSSPQTDQSTSSGTRPPLEVEYVNDTLVIAVPQRGDQEGTTSLPILAINLVYTTPQGEEAQEVYRSAPVTLPLEMTISECEESTYEEDEDGTEDGDEDEDEEDEDEDEDEDRDGDGDAVMEE